MNISTIIDAAATGDPNRTALIIDGRMISYGELAAAVEQCAARLAANGLSGCRVAIVDVGSLLSIATMLGAARIGAAAALMNPALTPPELTGLVNNAGCADVGVAGEAYAGRLREGGASTVLTATDLLDAGEVSAPPPVEDVDGRDALVLFTSGTTGLPKAIGITNGQLSARITGVATPFRADVPPTVSMMSVPFFHVGGAIGMLGNLYSGNTYVVQDRFDA
jgi:acyl-CoA synthetase (AMP-forming)/AMP-acid ligase II